MPSIYKPDFIQDDTARGIFTDLVQRGYTVRAIRKRMAGRGFPISADISDAVLINWMRTVRVDLEQDRSEADQDFTLLFGMASGFERARRLIELAEEIESKAASDKDWANTYRQLLAQIKIELEPYSLTVTPGDGWAALLEQLIAVGNGGGEGDGVDQSDVGTTPEIT